MRADESNGRLFVVVDYNLTRINDVRLLTSYARRAYGLRTVLVRGHLKPHDRELADHAIDLSPRTPGFVKAAAEHVLALGTPVAVLPFSDDAVQTGAALAARLDVRADSAALADAAFSKEAYRTREWQHCELFAGAGVHTPAFQVVWSYAELARFYATHSGGFVVKPTCEGNNRGVLRVDPGTDLATVFGEVQAYVGQGLICEELIDWPEEYSFDGIGHLSWVTEKLSASGRYPVERGQTVNAPLSPRTIAAVQRAGTLANLMCGQRLGPFHNEVKLDRATGVTAVMEPNRRPAGMFIWHLAARVFGVNPFHLWVDQMVTGQLPLALPPPRGTAAIRMLPAPFDGVMDFDETRRAQVEAELAQGLRARLGTSGAGGAELELFDFAITAAPGVAVWETPRDNSHFIARISAYSPITGPTVAAALDRVEDTWRELAHDIVQPIGSRRAGAA
jgi:hypothetical protein